LTITKRKPVLIGLYSSIPQQGKSTAASLIWDALERAGYGSPSRVAFADPVKYAAASFLEQALYINDITATKIVFDGKNKPLPTGDATGRDVLVWIGEGGRALLGPDVWVNRAMAFTDRAMKRGISVIIDDVRRENEAEAILDRGGVLVRVTRTAAGTLEPTVLLTDTEGRLETLDFTATLHNSGTLRDLKRLCGTFVKGLKQ
jgi:hypothetical protein